MQLIVSSLQAGTADAATEQPVMSCDANATKRRSFGSLRTWMTRSLTILHRPSFSQDGFLTLAGWDCAIYLKADYAVRGQVVVGSVFAADDIPAGSKRLLHSLVSVLEKPRT